jgi:hypothetical protein
MSTNLSGIPIQNLPFLYGNNLLDSWNSNTTLALTAGQCRDSTNIYDIVLNNPLIINAAVNGVNGLDRGTLANNTWYYLFVLSDPRGFLPTGAVLSLSYTSPTIPYDYGAFRYIGAWRTNGSAQFLQMRKYGAGSYRTCWWDAPVLVLNAGAAASFTAVNLVTAVPPKSATNITLEVDVKPTAAGNTAVLRPTGSTGSGNVTVSGAVSAVDQIVQVTSECLIANIGGSLVPAIDYEVTGSVTLNVTAFQDYL